MCVKISIIMPSLNVADYIEEAVQSVRNQTLREIEIICIDAGSNDGTWEILQSLAKLDKRILLYHSDVRSYGYQVNMGINLAKGKYIAVLETDDYVATEMYEKLYEKAVLYDCDYVKGDYFAYWTQENGERFFLKKTSFLNDELYGKVLIPKHYNEIATDDWYLWTGIYKKDFLIEHSIYLSETPGAAFQDIGFLFQTTLKANKAFYLKEYYYYYCIDRENASSNSGKALFYAYQEFNCLCKNMEINESLDFDALSLLYCRMAKSFMCCYAELKCKELCISDSERMHYYQWFQSQLKTAEKRGILNKQRLHSEIWDKVQILLMSEEHYIKKAKEHDHYIKTVLGKDKDYPIVIFGCGYYGYNAYLWTKRQGYNIVFFIDNNEALWGTKIDGFSVKSPKQATEVTKRLKYLIANQQHSEEMKKQLMSMNVEKEDICIYI